MTAKKNVSARSLGSDLAKVDAHEIKASEYDDLPEQAFYMVGSIDEVVEKAKKL